MSELRESSKKIESIKEERKIVARDKRGRACYVGDEVFCKLKSGAEISDKITMVFDNGELEICGMPIRPDEVTENLTASEKAEELKNEK